MALRSRVQPSGALNLNQKEIMHAVPRTLQKLPNAVPKDAVRHMSSCRSWAYGVGLESLQSSPVATDVTVCACRSLGHMTLNGTTDIKIGANYAVRVTEAARAMLHNGHCQHRILLQSSRHVLLNKRACKVTSRQVPLKCCLCLQVAGAHDLEWHY